VNNLFAGGFVVMLGWNKAEVGEVEKVTPKLFKVSRGTGWRAMQYPHSRALACFASKDDADKLAQSLDGALGQRNERVRRARADADVRIGEANEAYDKIQARLIAAALETETTQ
jgi:hypothetical protein